MHVDLEDAGAPAHFNTRICIVGAGVAGILLASSLAAKGIATHLLEAGGLVFEERSQELFAVEDAGTPHSGATEGRFRTFGGSSTRWGAQMLPYTQDVLHPPAALGLPEWPLELAEIEPYYREIEQFFAASPRPFSDDLLQEFGLSRPFISDEVRLRFSKWAPFTRRNLAGTLGKECLASPLVTVFTHANVLSIELNPNGSAVSSLTVTNYQGRRFQFSAQTYVLGTGTIETSRLLLASTSVCANGVGNCRDQVGRYFHDHIGVPAAEIPASDRSKVVDRFAPFLSGGTLHTPKLEATAALRADQKLLSVMAHFPIEEPENSGAGRVRAVLRGLQRRKFDRDVRQNLMALPAASVEVAQLLWSAKMKNRRALSKGARIALHIDCEQRPDGQSRIRLSAEKDRLDMPKAVVDWRVSDEEHETVRKFAQTIDRLLRDAGIASVAWHPELAEPGSRWLTRATDTYHMMGGARMGTDPSSSVVDSNLCVHGIENLFIASCAVFPTGGSSNPTFTMIALALRLKDRIAAS